MHFPGILVEEKELMKSKDVEQIKRELEKQGYVIVKEKKEKNLLKVFDDNVVFTCNKDETIFSLSFLSNVIARIVITDKLTTVITFTKRKNTSYTFKIGRIPSLKGIRETYNVSSYELFLERYLEYLSNNNDEEVLNWLRRLMREKKTTESTH
ncbi:hypothetical protein [Sulfolobus acidocaldarius]|uniref:Uncharacterized protein n=4 Tax=Sulfolobus acidocaldarius TaxID=2285 RepID=Q4JCC4_SULAC|nr:hypothetical protein [Sulfolobus acidocaldarius]AAY79555.1 hypothetical protein Saci_0132 [Sulfolobus acidocaldarius DSM 639]